MRARTLAVIFTFALASTAMAKDIYLSVGGSVGVFRTDARIFNPSPTKSIQVQAWFLPSGNNDNTAVQPVTITVPKRDMAVYDDVVSSLFHSSGVGAIRLSSADDFVATQRIFAVTDNGTLGQFVPGLDASQAIKNGVLIQIKSSNAFRTNLGSVNPNNAPAHVTWHLYDKSNALVATGTPVTIPPFGVVSSTNIASGFFFAASGDLSDSWVSFTSDQPIFAYASVVDNGTTDPTFIPASADSGADQSTTTPPPATGQSFDVNVSSFQIDIAPAPSGLKPGDQVTFHIHALDAGHGFQLVDPDGQVLIADPSGTGFKAGANFDASFTVTAQGTYTYYCTHPTCGSGHNAMIGTFDVGASTPDNGGRY